MPDSRTKIAELLRSTAPGTDVVVKGWVRTKRGNKNVAFIAVNDGFDTLTARRGADGYLVPLKNLINEVYSKDISRKSGSALAAKQKKGDFIGAWAPYGYRKQPDNPHKLEPDEALIDTMLKAIEVASRGHGRHADRKAAQR